MKKLLLSIFALLLSFNLYAQEEIAPIVNPSNSLSEVTPYELQSYYNQTILIFPNGNVVQLYILPDDSEETQTFIYEILNTDLEMMSDVFLETLYSSRSSSQIIKVRNSEEIKQIISNNHNGLGYAFIQKEDLIKILKIGEE